jgi:hypothetical protein
MPKLKCYKLSAFTQQMINKFMHLCIDLLHVFALLFFRDMFQTKMSIFQAFNILANYSVMHIKISFKNRRYRMLLKMAVFCGVVPCSLVEVYQRFRGTCCLHHQGDECPVNGDSKYL